MKKIDGVQIGNRILRYGNNVFQTDGGFLLKFITGAEQWQGMFPGCSWDHYYDIVMTDLCSKHFSNRVLRQRQEHPTIIVGSNIGLCHQCNSTTDCKFCSVSCWFFYTIELARQVIKEAEDQSKIEQQVEFVERAVALYGQQVDEELANLNPTQL